MNTISLANALQNQILTKYSRPVISYYSFTTLIGQLYKDKKYDGVNIGKISSSFPSKKVIDRNINSLIMSGGLSQISTLPIFEISGHTPASVQQVICELNPFCYLSHLSAMEWHSLTDRIPKTVHVTTSTSKEFRILAQSRMDQDFSYIHDDLEIPYLKHHKILQSIKGKAIKEHTSSDYQSKRALSNTGGVRVSTIGETFLDMLRSPDFCGGIAHVLDVFLEHAPSYLPVIAKTITKKGKPIDKVRAGYILEEKLRLKHPDFEDWARYAQRGGSRKLVSSQPYQNRFSEKWCISLNFVDG